jgi:hypothetical protein
MKLKQELSSLQTSSKGGQQAVDRTKKDLEKTRSEEICVTIFLLEEAWVAFFSASVATPGKMPDLKSRQTVL